MTGQIPAWAREKATRLLADWLELPSIEGSVDWLASALVAAKLDGWREERDGGRVCGAIYGPDKSLRYIDLVSDEEAAWRNFLGWPNTEEINWAKLNGYRFEQVIAVARALPDPEEKVEPRTIYGAPGESEGTHDNDT